MKHSNKLTLMGGQQEVFQYHAARAAPREPDGGWRAEAKAGGARTCGRGARGSPASGMCETGREETMDGPGYEGFRWRRRRVESRSSLEPTHPSAACGVVRRNRDASAHRASAGACPAHAKEGE